MLRIKSALLSVYSKDHLDKIVKDLERLKIKIYSTGGTADFVEKQGVEVHRVEDLTGYPSILGGRVKTLHPKVFGGILGRRSLASDEAEMEKYEIPAFDLIVVDLYPFEETVTAGGSHEEIIEKIDIGGISLIRAAAKNYKDVLIVSSQFQYGELDKILNEGRAETSLELRRRFAGEAFAVSSNYDTAIFNYFSENNSPYFKESRHVYSHLRYGENPHQEGRFYGDIDTVFTQLHGKEISYNNLLDIDAALRLIDDFESISIAILKHNNACGLASRDSLVQCWKDALAGDPVSAYGGIIITNRAIDAEVAEEMDKIFFEVIIAPGYSDGALENLKKKKNRIILKRKETKLPQHSFRSLLNGVLWQDLDQVAEKSIDLKVVTNTAPSANETEDLLFANKVVKHTKSNAIVLAKGGQLIASGTGQTSRIDALKQAIQKSAQFGFDLQGAVLASDAFFPFKDSMEIAFEAGIKTVIQPGGSIRDQESIDYCNEHQMSMVFTGKRHFKH